MIELKRNELYREIGIYVDGDQIGEAEVELTERMLSKYVN